MSDYYDHERTFGEPWNLAFQTCTEHLGMTIEEAKRLDSTRRPTIFGCAAWWVHQNRARLQEYNDFWFQTGRSVTNPEPGIKLINLFNAKFGPLPEEIEKRKHDWIFMFCMQALSIAKYILEKPEPVVSPQPPSDSQPVISL